MESVHCLLAGACQDEPIRLSGAVDELPHARHGKPSTVLLVRIVPQNCPSVLIGIAALRRESAKLRAGPAPAWRAEPQAR